MILIACESAVQGMENEFGIGIRFGIEIAHGLADDDGNVDGLWQWHMACNRNVSAMMMEYSEVAAWRLSGCLSSHNDLFIHLQSVKNGMSVFLESTHQNVIILLFLTGGTITELIS